MGKEKLIILNLFNLLLTLSNLSILSINMNIPLGKEYYESLRSAQEFRI